MKYFIAVLMYGLIGVALLLGLSYILSVEQLAAPLVRDERRPLVIVFDLHEVITQKDLPRMNRIIRSMVWHHPRESMRLLYRVYLWYRYPRTSIPTAEWVIDKELLGEPDLDVLRPYLHTLINAHRIQPAMERILHELHDQGYTLVLASNIGPQAFQDYLPVLEAHGLTKLFSATLTPSVENGYMHKPQPAFYEEIWRLVRELHPQAEILLVDDKQENIDGAQQAGMHTYLFAAPMPFHRWLEEQGVGSCPPLVPLEE